MTARISAAEAKKLGLTPDPDAPPVPGTGSGRRTGKRAKALYHSVCMTEGCGKEFKTEAAEERHLHQTHHARYQLVLDLKGAT